MEHAVVEILCAQVCVQVPSFNLNAAVSFLLQPPAGAAPPGCEADEDRGEAVW